MATPSVRRKPRWTPPTKEVTATDRILRPSSLVAGLRKPCLGIVLARSGHHQPEEIAQQATREIAARYGELDNLGKALEDREDMAASLGEVIRLITLLANQSGQIHNLTHPDQRPGLTTKAVELLTVPADLADYRGAISVALSHGTRRAIQVESDPKEPTPTRSRSSP